MNANPSAAVSTRPRPTVGLGRQLTADRLGALLMVVGAGLTAFILMDPRMREESIYLLVLTALTFVPAVLLRPTGLTVASFMLLCPTLWFSFESLLLRLGWFNLFQFYEGVWPLQLSEDALKKTAWLVLLANAALWLGYVNPLARWAGGSLVERLKSQFQGEGFAPHMPRVWALFLVGTAARIYMIRAGIGGYFIDLNQYNDAASYMQYLVALEGLSTLAMLTCGAATLRGSRPDWKPFGIMFAVEIATVVMIGFKGQIVYRFFYVAVLMTHVKRRFPWRVTLGGAAALIVIFPINLAARQAFLQGDIQSGNLSSLVRGFSQGASRSFQGASIGSLVAESVEGITRASGYLEPFAMVVQYVDDTGTCWYGVDYLYPVISFIPRAVWPDKPTANRGQWVYTVVYGMPEATSAQVQTVPGDFYLNFNWMGVVVGMVVVGMMGRAATELVLSTTSLRWLPIVPSIVYGFGLIGSDVGVHFAGLVRLYAFQAAVLVFLVPSTRTRRRAPSGPPFNRDLASRIPSDRFSRSRTWKRTS